MLYISKVGVIRLTRGDTADFSISVQNEVSKDSYEIQAGDTFRFTVKESSEDTDIVLQKVLNGLDSFTIEPDDTKSLEYGDYVYDVELTTEDGDVYTIIPPSRFTIMEEVTW